MSVYSESIPKAPFVNLFLIIRLNARKRINEQETSFIDVGRALNTRSGLSLPDNRNLSVDNERTPVCFVMLFLSKDMDS